MLFLGSSLQVTFEALAHVGGADGEIDACGASDTEHNQTSSAATN